MHFTADQREAWNRDTKLSPFNLWLDARVKRADGTLDLDRLHALARRYGVDVEAAYRHLNPGQQRMNIGNRLRHLVPARDYAGASGPEPMPASPAAPDPDFPWLADAPVIQLMQIHGAVLEELRRRDIVRTGNGPVGDYAEMLFARAFGWALTGNSAAGHDAVGADGATRYQVKARRITPRNPARQLSFIRRLPERPFDWLAGVLFDGRYNVMRAALIPYEIVAVRARFVAHTNGWRFILDDAVWLEEGVSDATEKLRAAASAL